jgi:soluble epoxide hydrolase/lipid-phosphate phosphatase
MDSKFQLPDRQIFTSQAGHAYSHIHIKPRNEGATLLFLHGFPSHIPDWTNQIQHFSQLGCGLLIPDLLGYGQTSKPKEIDAYRTKAMSGEIAELLDHLNIAKVVGIGHDWGATLLSRLVTYHPGYFQALVFLAVGPPPPGTPFKVDQINEMTKKYMGIEMLGYIPWISKDPTAQARLEQNAESAMSLMFCKDDQEWNRWFRPLHKMKEFVEQDKRLTIGPWYPSELREAHLKAFGKDGGYFGAHMWYLVWMDELFVEDEKGFEDTKIQQPTLFIADNPPEAAAQQEGFLKQWVLDLKTAAVDSGHWVQLERADETNHLIEDFLNRL